MAASRYDGFPDGCGQLPGGNYPPARCPLTAEPFITALSLLSLRVDIDAQAQPGTPDGSTGPERFGRNSASRPGGVSRRPARRGSGALEQDGDSLAAADAHGGDGVAASHPLQLVERLDGDDGAGGADGVAQGDAGAVDIDPVHGQFQIAANRERLCGKGFVHFPDIDI